MLFSVKFSAALLTLALATPLRAQVLNDWTIPCTQGVCSWNLPAESGTEGWIQISGSPGSISDITPACGWTILTTCDPTSSSQDIQLVCEDNNPDCDQLFQGDGAVNTVVRMPESCGSNPFSRVAQHQIVQSGLITRDNGSEALVHQLTLDTDFTATGGGVNFSLQGQNWQSNSNTVNRRRSRPLARQSPKSNTGSVNWSGQQNLFNASDGSSSIDIEADLQASVSYTVFAAGSLVEIDQFNITVGLDGGADATLKISGNISRQVSLPSLTLYQNGIPGLSFPRILEVGPVFMVSASLDANFAAQNVNASVEVNYDLGDTSFFFPPPETLSSTSGIISSSDQVTFSADPGATLTASVHLIPEVNFGLKALDGLVSTSLFLDFDSSLSLQGNVSSATNSQPCLSGSADVEIEVGAKASFFHIFSPSTGIPPLFHGGFQLFDRCFT